MVGSSEHGYDISGPVNGGEFFLQDELTVNFSRRALFHGVNWFFRASVVIC
jgi:hypothetical protein